MKNIHILPTDKPSRLYLNTKEYIFDNEYSLSTDECQNKYIYITSDEEIKVGDWCLCSEELIHKVVEIKSNIGIIRFQDGVTEVLDACKKIILTTDELYIHNDLIPKEYNLFPQYIQKIDDEFLEWFVKNPSCEMVETVFNNRGISGSEKILKSFGEYKIIIPKTTQQVIDKDFAGGLDMGQIIPKEELSTKLHKGEIVDESYPKDFRKQETLEEVAERLLNLNELDSFRDYHYKQELYNAFIVGIKYQQERSYSEEDIALAFNEGQAYSVTGKLVDGKEWVKEHKKEWFEQFKKK